MEYSSIVIFAVFRLVFIFLLLFGWLAPLVLRYAGNQKGIDRIVYSWVGLGGLLICIVFVLIQMHVYDFISLVFTLILIPFLFYILKGWRNGKSLRDIFWELENKVLQGQLKAIESTRFFSADRFKDKLGGEKVKFTFSEKPYRLAALIIAGSATVVRIIPAITNSAPFTRSWYFELEAVKNLRLQEYFVDYPYPRGMHSIVQIFSTLTQVSPEMILHILGSLISFFLTIIIFWVIRDIIDRRFQVAAVFGAGLYALFPVLFMPITFELQTTTSSLSLALCFAIPTALFFLRNIRFGGNIPIFYLSMGMIATGLTDLFVFMIVLMPFLLISLIAVSKENLLKNLINNLFFLVVIGLVTLTPYIIFCLNNEINFFDFLKTQLFDSRVFSFYPELITDINLLSQIYLGTGIVMAVIIVWRAIREKERSVGSEMVFIVLFSLVSFIYTPYFGYAYIWIDPDQLNSFYSVLIAIFLGIVFYTIFDLINSYSKADKGKLQWASVITTAVLFVIIVFRQGGVQPSKVLPQTLPNGFYNAYYQIIDERVPYTYATVGPDLDRILAKNRHFFMNYNYFLNNYGVIDSLYQQYLTVEDVQRDNREVPPASIFLFVEKAPYGSIQQGILYDSPSMMRDMQQWLETFKTLENRVVDVYYENNNAIVYEIVNREDESKINSVLLNMYPKE